MMLSLQGHTFPEDSDVCTHCGLELTDATAVWCTGSRETLEWLASFSGMPANPPHRSSTRRGTG